MCSGLCKTHTTDKMFLIMTFKIVLPAGSFVVVVVVYPGCCSSTDLTPTVKVIHPQLKALCEIGNCKESKSEYNYKCTLHYVRHAFQLKICRMGLFFSDVFVLLHSEI